MRRRPPRSHYRAGAVRSLIPFIVIPKPGQDCCDFCATTTVVNVYACRNFIVPGTKDTVFAHESIGGWAACTHCSRFIDKGKCRQLTDRAVRRFIKLYNMPSYEYADLREQFRAVHHEFKKHMILPV